MKKRQHTYTEKRKLISEKYSGTKNFDSTLNNFSIGENVRLNENDDNEIKKLYECSLNVPTTIRLIEQRLRDEIVQWNPVTKKMEAWINTKQLKSILISNKKKFIQQQQQQQHQKQNKK